MLLHGGLEKEALEAYGFILLSAPETEIERRVISEMAELAVRIGTRAGGDERESYFAKARRWATDIQWGGRDLWFGKSVVILTQIEIAGGNYAKAREIIREYLPMLRQIDAALRAENAPLRFSPMAECRYQLGMLYLMDAESLAGRDDERAVEHFGRALRHLHNVFIGYPGSPWALEAGNEARRIVARLEDMGRRVSIPPFDKAPIIRAQLQEARMFLEMNDFERAENAYRIVLNLFPEEESVIPALAELARCYIETDNLLYAETVVRYLAERFYARAELREIAGATLLRVAGFHEEAGRGAEMHAVNNLFLRYYPEHSRAPALLTRLGESALRDEDYEQALRYFEKVRERFPESRAALEAMRRAAYCHGAMGNHTNAVAVLMEYAGALPSGPALFEARYRLAEARRSSGDYPGAAGEYHRLARDIAADTAAIDRNAFAPEDGRRLGLLREQALFWRAYCLSRLREPAAQRVQLQEAAIDGYRRFIADFPRSELAPAALSLKGALLFLLDRGDAAAAVYDRLARDYPDSEQARNALFAQGSSLIELGQMQRALAIFERMFEDTAAFTPAQFLQVGRVMFAEGQFATAVRALQAALGSDERAIWENAAILKGRTLLNLERFGEAAAVIEALLERYPASAHSVDANFMLSAAYARLAASMQENDGRRAPTYDRALRAMRAARRIATDPGERARADYELAGIQLLMGRADDALASYMRLFLLADINAAGVRPMVERAYAAAVPLLFDAGHFEDIIDSSRTYLEVFPGGRLAADARRWRDQARMRLAGSGGDGPAP